MLLLWLRLVSELEWVSLSRRNIRLESRLVYEPPCHDREAVHGSEVPTMVAQWPCHQRRRKCRVKKRRPTATSWVRIGGMWIIEPDARIEAWPFFSYHMPQTVNYVLTACRALQIIAKLIKVNELHEAARKYMQNDSFKIHRVVDSGFY